MSGKEVIRADRMFAEPGVNSNSAAVKDMIVGIVMGLGAGFLWQTWHWNENAKWENL